MTDKEFQDQLKAIYDLAVKDNQLTIALNILLMQRQGVKNEGPKITS